MLRLAQVAPGLAAMLASDRAGLTADLRAGLSTAAVALPAAVAFSAMMNLPPEAGLHASILPMAAYALFGPSRRLVVAADTATCVLVAGSLTALGLADPAERAGVAALLAVLAGVMCLGAALLRLGALADFLSWPILVGFLNGVAIDLMLGQLPRMLGVATTATDPLPRLLELARLLPAAHAPTVLVAFGTLALVLALRRLAPRLPAALLACLAAGGVSAALGLEARGVETLGHVPAAWPGFALPQLTLGFLAEHRFDLLEHAAGIALISFASFMIPARAFAARRGETTSADHEAAALGLCHLTAGLAQGFPVSASSTRTAVAEAAGAQGPASALTTATALGLAMALLGGPLAYLPRGAMAALLVQAALSLLDLAAVRALWRVERTEAVLAGLATLGVILAGPLNAVLISVALAILRFIRITARPVAEVLGRVPGLAGFHARARNPDAQVYPGITFFRFNAPLVFFNAPAFTRAAQEAVAQAGEGLEWFVLDVYPITQLDSTGFEALRSLRARLAAKGITLVLAGRQTEALAWLAERGLAGNAPTLFPTMNAARRAFNARRQAENSG